MRLHATVLLCATGLAFSTAGCGGTGAAQHPLTNELDPAYSKVAFATVAVLPFASDITEADDPDKVSASMFESKFVKSLSAASGFSLYAPVEVGRQVEQAKMNEAMQSFYKKWTTDTSDIDENFVKSVATLLKVDGVVAGVVDVWYQRHIDITETGSARTTVGGLVGLFDGTTGKRLWLGRDENFKEAVRHTGQNLEREVESRTAKGQMDRTNLRTATGVYAPPDFAEVVDLIIGPLVQAFPKRGK
jgi:hypothetical protein